ncbi:MAG TPA: hypothetical protein VI934_01165, partial [Candidatus Nanoarchaeia archaeon]|nr:hypothetical protein [Candidatus Nanoarchaeia archaeon]
MKNKVIIINPAHGTAPYIFGVQLAKSIADITGDRFSIVMPDFFGENQRRILKARWGEDSTIYLDKELGIGMQFNGSDSDLEKALELRPRIA